MDRIINIIFLFVLSTTAANTEEDGPYLPEPYVRQRWRPPTRWYKQALLDRLPQDVYIMNSEGKPIEVPFNLKDTVRLEDDYDSEREIETSSLFGPDNIRNAKSTGEKPPVKPVFQSICPSRRVTVYLNEGSDYDYRPDYYEEVTCVHTSHKSSRHRSKVCEAETGFFCVQLNRTIFLTRRQSDSDCWEVETRVVPSGCECMWPKHVWGDISHFHRAIDTN